MENGTDKRLEALNEFLKQEKKVVTNELKEIIKGVAKNGKYIYQWETLKPLYAHELEEVMENFLENFPPKNADGIDSVKAKELENERNSILKTFNKFTSAPFTLQRISELIIQPRKHYKTCAKFFRGLTKNVLVVSTIDPEESDTNTVDLQESDTESDERPSKKMRLTPEQHTTVSSPNELRPPVLQTTNSAMLESAVLVNGRVDDTTGQTSNAEQNLEAEQAETQTPASDAANVDTLDGLNADKTEETNAGTQEKQEDRDEKMTNEGKPHVESTSNTEDVHVTIDEEAEQKEKQVEQQQLEQQTEQKPQSEQQQLQEQLTVQQQQQTEQQQRPEQQTEQQQQLTEQQQQQLTTTGKESD